MCIIQWNLISQWDQKHVMRYFTLTVVGVVSVIIPGDLKVVRMFHFSSVHINEVPLFIQLDSLNWGA